jgi:hypothetical protein
VETAPPSPSPCRRLCPGPSLLPEAPAATVRHSARFPGLSPGKHGAARPAVSRIEGGATRNRTCMPSLAPYPWREKERETDFQCEKTVRKEADKKSIFPGGSCTQPRDGTAIAALPYAWKSFRKFLQSLKSNSPSPVVLLLSPLFSRLQQQPQTELPVPYVHTVHSTYLRYILPHLRSTYLPTSVGRSLLDFYSYRFFS